MVKHLNLRSVMLSPMSFDFELGITDFGFRWFSSSPFQSLLHFNRERLNAVRDATRCLLYILFERMFRENVQAMPIRKDQLHHGSWIHAHRFASELDRLSLRDAHSARRFAAPPLTCILASVLITMVSSLPRFVHLCESQRRSL